MSGKSRGSDEIIRCNEDGSPMENWKKFQGSELGSLLAGIYGGTRPKINYPKPKQNKSAPNIKDSTWRAVSNKPDAVDPRKTTRRDTSGRLDVPKVNGGRGRSKLALVDCIPQRRNETSIRNEMDNLKSKITSYRPARTYGGRDGNEKDRLGQIFEFKGGKALPTELTSIIQEAPFEREAKRKENLINSRFKIVNGQKIEVDEHTFSTTTNTNGSDKAASNQQKSASNYNDELTDQIIREIEERQEYLKDMRDNLSQQEQIRIKMEMQTRLYELDKLGNSNKK